MPVSGQASARVNADSKFDAGAMRASLAMVRQTVGRYFRLEAHGGENIPDGGCMVVGCHSGVVPYDAACALVAIEDVTGRLGRSVGDHLWGRVKVIERFLHRRGVIVGERDGAAQILRAGHILLVMPGGTLDMTRPIWRDAYRVLPHKGFARERGGYIKLALSTGVPILPMAVVGAEEAHMLLYNMKGLAQRLRAPFFPLVAFLFPLPVKIRVRFGRPIRFREGPQAANDQAVVDRLNTRTRRALQALIDDTLRRRKGVIWSRYDAAPSGRRHSRSH